MTEETSEKCQGDNKHTPKTVAVAGATGMIGTHLVHALCARGDQVIALVRSPEEAVLPPAIEVRQWEAADPVAPVEGADAVVNLVGQPIMAEPWTEARKKSLAETRVGAVESIVAGIRHSHGSIDTFLSASAIEYSGDTGEQRIDETVSAGNGFLAELSQQWESPACEPDDLDARVVIMRNGFVLGREGALLPGMLSQSKYGFSGRYGSGKQWWSWIHVDDDVRLIIHALEHSELSGPVNFVSPTPVRNREFAATFARVLNRPAVIPLPKLALRILFSDGRDALLLDSHRVIPQQALDTGFEFSYPSLSVALADLVSTGAQATRFDHGTATQDYDDERTDSEHDERIVLQHRSDTLGTDTLTMEEHLDPHHSGPPEHIHPYQTEQFSVTAGRLSVVMDTEEQVFGPGETVEIPRGTAHTFRNDGATRVEFTTELRPALRSREFFETVQKLETTGDFSDAGILKNLPVGVLLTHNFRHEWQPVRPSQLVQRTMIPIGARIGTLFGYHLPPIPDTSQ